MQVDQALVEVSHLIQEPIVLALLVLVFGLLLGLAIGRINKRILTAAGIGDAVEGTAFERTARSIGTSTVALIARVTSWFIYGVTILTAIHISGLFDAPAFWVRVAEFAPRLLIAVLVVIAGFILADKAELAVSERVVFTGYVNHDEVYDVYDPAESISFFKYQGSPKNIPEHLVGGYPLVATNFGNVSTLLDLKGRSCLRTR